MAYYNPYITIPHPANWVFDHCSFNLEFFWNVVKVPMSVLVECPLIHSSASVSSNKNAQRPPRNSGITDCVRMVVQCQSFWCLTKNQQDQQTNAFDVDERIHGWKLEKLCNIQAAKSPF